MRFAQPSIVRIHWLCQAVPCVAMTTFAMRATPHSTYSSGKYFRFVTVHRSI